MNLNPRTRIFRRRRTLFRVNDPEPLTLSTRKVKPPLDLPKTQYSVRNTITLQTNQVPDTKGIFTPSVLLGLVPGEDHSNPYWTKLRVLKVLVYDTSGGLISCKFLTDNVGFSDMGVSGAEPSVLALSPSLQIRSTWFESKGTDPLFQITGSTSDRLSIYVTVELVSN